MMSPTGERICKGSVQGTCLIAGITGGVVGLPKSHRRYHLEGFRIVSTSNGECSMLSRAAEVKRGR